MTRLCPSLPDAESNPDVLLEPIAQARDIYAAIEADLQLLITSAQAVGSLNPAGESGKSEVETIPLEEHRRMLEELQTRTEYQERELIQRFETLLEAQRELQRKYIELQQAHATSQELADTVRAEASEAAERRVDAGVQAVEVTAEKLEKSTETDDVPRKVCAIQCEEEDIRREVGCGTPSEKAVAVPTLAEVNDLLYDVKKESAELAQLKKLEAERASLLIEVEALRLDNGEQKDMIDRLRMKQERAQLALAKSREEVSQQQSRLASVASSPYPSGSGGALSVVQAHRADSAALEEANAKLHRAEAEAEKLYLHNQELKRLLCSSQERFNELRLICDDEDKASRNFENVQQELETAKARTYSTFE